MNPMRRPGLLSLAALVVIGVGVLAVAGDLNPPAGPVVPTMKTLDEVEARIPINAANTPGDADSLYKITQPGSYYLTGNITGEVGKHGVEIAASGVTLDLNGFDLVGVPGMGAFDGVSVTVDSLRGIAVLNGSVRDWGDGGVDLGFLSRGCRVEGVRASGNAGTGITSSISSTVTNCTASFNGQRGIFSSNGSTISNCSVESNGGNGFQVNQGCTVANSAAYFNTLDGVFASTGCRVTDTSAYSNRGDGIQVGEGSSVTNCTANNNDGLGFFAANACAISASAAAFNDFDGFSAANGSTITGCSARSNGVRGIACGNGGTVIECTASENADTGILGLGSVSIIDCTSHANGGNGIFLGSGVVSGSSAVFNATNGISCTSGTTVRDNACISNGQSGAGAGILAAGGGIRIVGNKCSSAPIGISVSTAGNFITANSCSQNTTDWVIAAGNAIGPILDRRNPGGAAVNGFAAPTTLNTTDPHANFSH